MLSSEYSDFVASGVPLPDLVKRSRMRPIAVGIADTHIRPGARIWKHSSRPYGDIIYALYQCAYVVRELNPEFVLLLGDILHANINPADVLGIVSDFLSRLPEEIPVYYVQGQHDLSTPPWLSLVGPNSGRPILRPLESLLLRSEAGVSVLGLDFTRTPYNAISAILDHTTPKEVDILVTHQAWKEVVGPAGNASFRDVEAIPGLKLVLSGDLHMFAQFSHVPQNNDYLPGDVRLASTPKTGGFKIIFPGNPCITDMNGQPPFGVVAVWPDLSVTHIPLLGRSVYRVDLQTLDDLDKFREEHPAEKMHDAHLPGDLQKPILYASGCAEVLLSAKACYSDVTYFRMASRDTSLPTSGSPVILHTEGYDFRVQLLNYLSSKNPKYAAAYREFLRVLADPDDRDSHFQRAISAILAAEDRDADSSV